MVGHALFLQLAAKTAAVDRRDLHVFHLIVQAFLRDGYLHIVRRVARAAALAVALEEHGEDLAHAARKIRFVHRLGDSRGARSAVFVDESRDAVQLVLANLALCRLQGDVVQGESRGYLRTCGKFDLIFLDPPYDTGLLDKALENVVQFDILAEGGIIVCESRREKVLPQLRAPYHLLTERNYGKIKLTLYGKGIHA